MLKALNPIKIIAGWILLVMIIDVIAVPYFFFNSVGGEQKPLTFLMSSVKIAMIGIFLLSILTSFLYIKWFKKFWFANCFFFLLSGIYIYQDQRANNEIQYSFHEKNDSIGGYEYKSRIEYYSLEKNEVRSQSYWKNGMKDSVWTIYSEKGNILKQERYKNGNLIK
jgi:hypothetical protein